MKFRVHPGWEKNMNKMIDILQNIYPASRKGANTFRIPKCFFFHLLSKSQKEPFLFILERCRATQHCPIHSRKHKVLLVAKRNCPLDAIGALLDRLARVCEGGVTRRWRKWVEWRETGGDGNVLGGRVVASTSASFGPPLSLIPAPTECPLLWAKLDGNWQAPADEDVSRCCSVLFRHARIALIDQWAASRACGSSSVDWLMIDRWTSGPRCVCL